MSAFGADTPVAVRETFGRSLTAEQALAGWIALFDGETTFGFRDGKLGQNDGRALLSAGTTTSAFANCELRVQAMHAGRLLHGKQSLTVVEGWNSLALRELSGALTLSGGLIIEAIYLKPSQLKSLFNGRNLVDWDLRSNAHNSSPPPARWSVENGAIRVQGGPGALEYAPRESQHLFGDFIAQMVVRTRVDEANGGFFFRNQPGKTMMGYEAQLHNPWYDHSQGQHGYTTGGIDDRQQARRAVASDRTPFRLTVLAQGAHLATWVNGYPTVDWIDPRPIDPNPRRGLRTEPGTLQLQAHDPKTDLEFLGVWVQPFD